MPGWLPVCLDVAGKRCVIIGGGQVAVRKAQVLLRAGARVAVFAPSVADCLRHLAQTGDLEIVAEPYRVSMLEGAWLVFAATDSAELNRRIAADATQRRIFVCAVTAATGSSLLMPAVLRRGWLTVAVATAGRSPGFAAWIRDWLADRLGPEYGELAQLLGELRDQGVRLSRSRLRQVVDEEMLERIRRGECESVRERLLQCMS